MLPDKDSLYKCCRAKITAANVAGQRFSLQMLPGKDYCCKCCRTKILSGNVAGHILLLQIRKGGQAGNVSLLKRFA
jgi:hypothetical protein